MTTEQAYVDQEELINRPEIAAVCSEQTLQRRSRNPARTQGWLREPWPIAVGDKKWILHCLISSQDGELAGSWIRSGA